MPATATRPGQASAIRDKHSPGICPKLGRPSETTNDNTFRASPTDAKEEEEEERRDAHECVDQLRLRPGCAHIGPTRAGGGADARDDARRGY
eukprot:7871521-Pyramimonas_sp.AAC.1